jgi:hypothetical protein
MIDNNVKLSDVKTLAMKPYFQEDDHEKYISAGSGQPGADR